jgi:hypothetical protein
MARSLGPSFVIGLLPHFRALFLLTPRHPVTPSPPLSPPIHDFLPKSLAESPSGCHYLHNAPSSLEDVAAEPLADRSVYGIGGARASVWMEHAPLPCAIAKCRGRLFPAGWREGSNDHGRLPCPRAMCAAKAWRRNPTRGDCRGGRRAPHHHRTRVRCGHGRGGRGGGATPEASPAKKSSQRSQSEQPNKHEHPGPAGPTGTAWSSGHDKRRARVSHRQV